MKSRYILGFGLFAIVVLVGAGGLTLQQLAMMKRNAQIVSEYYESLLDLENMLSQAKDLEVGTRGYLLTKDTVFLGPYHSGRSTLHSELALVLSRERRLIGHDSVQMATLDSLKIIIEQRLAASVRLVERIETDSLPGAEKAQIDLMKSGKQGMDNARRLISRIRTHRHRILAAQMRALDDYTHNIPLYVWSLSGIALTVLAILFYVLTEQLRALQRYRDSLETRYLELGAAYENLGRYNTLANHHLKEPVRKMLLFLDRYRSKHGAELAKAERDLTDKMSQLSMQMYRLLDDLSMFSELDVNGLPDKRRIDLKDLFQDILQKLKPRIDETKGSVTLPARLPAIHGAPQQIHYLLAQLLQNALTFTRPGETPQISIRVHTGPVDPETEKPRLPATVRSVHRIRVIDNGRGIPVEYQDRVFQLFFQLNDPGNTGSTGLGLALCQKIAQLHGGFITLNNNSEEHGCVVTVVLPA